MTGSEKHGREQRPLDEIEVTAIRGIGPGVAARLAGIGIETVHDLLFHLPYRYEDRTQVTPIGALRAGAGVLVFAEVELAQVRFGRRRSLAVSIADGTGQLLLRFFHFSESQRRGFQRGARIACFGEPRLGPRGMEMVHPEYRLLPADAPAPTTDHLTPVYPATEGLSQISLRRFTDGALAMMERNPSLVDLLPPSVVERHRLAPLASALKTIHRPPPGTAIAELQSADHPCRQRLAFEELLAHHLSLRVLRRRLDGEQAPRFDAQRSASLIERYLEVLPFELTAAQRRVAEEIRLDLERDRPMHRLVQGDVGSGKTVVAALAVLQAVASDHQAAVMAPTELLAEQHFANFTTWFEAIGIEVAWLSGKLAARARAEATEKVASGAARVTIGTHALFQESVKFARLGLVVVDEQHRFGVDQRLALRGKGESPGIRPHQLIMTATPIPRTLAMTAYADLDSSVIDELPPGRTPVETAVVPSTRRSDVVDRIHRACRDGQQAYWVCTLIEESDTLQVQAAADTAETLAEALPDLRVGLIHGRMKPAEKDAVMQRFKTAEIDLLVATTVIEVGVDVPNASLMIIENAERLGLAQLHQLRGRVGRGSRRSACVMMYDGQLTETARIRLDVLRSSNDGFEIAQRDLEIRGPGDVLGTRQTGLVQFRIADLIRDRALLPAVERVGEELLAAHGDEVPLLIRRWVGPAVDYGRI